jgi:hypothetical protein
MSIRQSEPCPAYIANLCFFGIALKQPKDLITKSIPLEKSLIGNDFYWLMFNKISKASTNPNGKRWIFGVTRFL